jgi:oligogalacturonide transporter
MTTQTERLSLWQKIGYGLGDIYGGGSGTLIGALYLYFLTDVVRINPALAGVVILISKVYDSITDPFEGIIADRTRTRLGRRKPYLLVGIPFVFLSFFFLFFPYNSPSETQRFILVLGSYLFFSTVVSIVMLNYNALQSELTLDYNERTTLSSFRIFFSTVSSFLCALLPLPIVHAFADVRQGYIIMALGFGLFFAIPFVATIFSVHERSEFQKPPMPFKWEIFLVPFRVRTFVYSLMMYLMAFVAIDTVSSILVYYMTYYLRRGEEFSYVFGTLFISQVIILPVYTALSRRTGKARSYMLGAFLWMGIMLISLLITPQSPAWFIYVFAVLVGFATGGVVVMMYAIFPDIPDVDELASGQRREAMFSALVTFLRKVSSALAIFIVSVVISVVGYVRPVEEVVEGATKLIEQPQSAGFLMATRLILAFVPPLLLVVALFFAARYPLSPERHARLKDVLTRRRAGLEDTPAQAIEAARLQKELAG